MLQRVGSIDGVMQTLKRLTPYDASDDGGAAPTGGSVPDPVMPWGIDLFSSSNAPIASSAAPITQGPASQPATSTYTVRTGDSLSAIAQRTLGSSNRWSEIYNANRDKLSTPNAIFPGQVLKIPNASARTAAPAAAPSKTPSAATSKGSYWDYADSLGSKYGVDPNLIMAVMQAESQGNPSAVSSAGAVGLMQLMPDTAATYGVTNRRNALQNMTGGTRYLKSLLDMFGGNVREAVAAYNAGPGAVQAYGGVPPYGETRAYVNKVLGTYNSYAALA